MKTFWRTCRISAVAAIVLAAMLSLSFAATATAEPDPYGHCGPPCQDHGGPGPTGDPEPEPWPWPPPEPAPDPEPDPDDLWTSECDDEGDCESVPGFLDLGPDAGPGSTPPSGPFGSGPRP